MSADTVVGLLTLLGLLYVAWMQSGTRQADVRASDAEAMQFSAEAVTHMTSSLLQVVEKLADRDRLIAELRARIETLEEHDDAKTARIAELERKIGLLEQQRAELQQERDGLAVEVAKLKMRNLPK